MIHDILARYKKWCQDSRWVESAETFFYYIVIPALVISLFAMMVLACWGLAVAAGGG